MIKTTRIVATLLASTTAALLVSATAQAGTIAGGVLQVGSDLTYPPYDYVDSDSKPATQHATARAPKSHKRHH